MGLNRSPFFKTREQGGTSQWFVIDSRLAPGNVFFVQSTNSNAGDSPGKGQTPDAPFATINYAVSQCTADQGDLILVLPGHVETLTAAAAVAVNVAGVTILGLGEGRQRPRVNYTTSAAASFDVTAARCKVENLFFTGAGVASVTAMVNVQAADCVLKGCEFEHANATNQAALVVLTTAAADRLRVEGCFFHGSNNAGTAAAISLVGGDAIVLRDNLISGAYHASNGVIKNATTDCTNLQVVGNVVQNFTAVNTKSVVLTAGSTGQIANNRFQVLSGTAPITGAAMSWVGGNYYSATVATAGTLI
jgi:hypothetical protein